MKKPPQSVPTDPDLLPHQSIGKEGQDTIIFIHGGFSSANEWDLVAPLLASHYHLLLPDLPAHGRAAHIRPFTLTTTSGLLAQLIQSRASHAKAHVVGLSLGAVVAAHLASHYPQVVESVIASGFLRLPPTKTSAFLPSFFLLESYLTRLIPPSVTRYLMDGVDVRPANSRSLELCKQVSAVLISADPVDPIPARTLVIAATKSGLIPSGDRVEDTRKLGNAAKKANPESRILEHPGMRHPWNRQDPKLFAATVKAWVEHLELPKGFQEL